MPAERLGGGPGEVGKGGFDRGRPRVRRRQPENGVGEVPLLGPEDLSFNDLAAIMSEVLGQDVRFQQTTFDAYNDRFVSFGMSEAMARGMTDMARAKNEGLDNGVQRTPQNSTPTGFRQWCEEALKPTVAP